MAQVTLDGTRNDDRENRDACRDEAAAASLTNDDDLVDIARNPYSSIKSVYFPPNPPAVPGDSARPETRRRANVTDVNALLMLHHELGPLGCQLSKIIGKARALGLNGAKFDLDPCGRRSDQRLHLPDRPTLSANGGHFDHGRTSRPAATSPEDRSGLVGKTTSPSSTFSVVDKWPVPGESHTSWLLNGSSRQRQEALSLGESTRALERLGESPAWSSARLSVSHLPTDASSRREDVLLSERPRDGRASQVLRRKSFGTIERDMFAWKAWSSHSSRVRVDRSSREIGRGVSRQSLYRSVDNSRTSHDLGRRRSLSGDQLHRWNSSRTICHSPNFTPRFTVMRVIDGIRSIVGRLDALVSGGLNSTAIQTSHVAIRGGLRHKSTQTERVAEDGRPISLRYIDRAAGPDRQIPRAVSAAASQIRIVSTEFRAAVVKRCTSRAVSPIRDSPPRAKDAARTVVSPPPSSSSSKRNILFTTAVSNVFVQQVRGLPNVARSPAVEKNGVARSERDPRPRNFHSRPEDSSKLCEENHEEATPAESRKTRQRPPGKSAPGASTGACPNSTTSDFADEPELNRRLARRSPKARSSSKGGDAPSPPRQSASESYACSTEEESAGEGRQNPGETLLSRVSRSGLRAKNRSSSTASVVLRDDAKRPIQARRSRPTRPGGKARGGRRSAAAGTADAVRAIAGMRCSPEDFFCDT